EQMAVPGQRHEDIGTDQQEDGQNTRRDQSDRHFDHQIRAKKPGCSSTAGAVVNSVLRVSAKLSGVPMETYLANKFPGSLLRLRSMTCRFQPHASAGTSLFVFYRSSPLRRPY